jgi:hypothetical protein
MLSTEHLVVCGGATAHERGGAARLDLNLDGPSANVRLEIKDISRRLLANISDIHADLLEIASYSGRQRHFAWRQNRPASRRSVAKKISVCDSGTSASIVVV